jgi:ABC-2 type transport system ATP-binding protein/lipopolysaccharide transport system ATP-binding protein
MEDLQRSGRTVVFVSHDLGAVGRLCDRTLWLDQGRVRFDGPTHETLRRYFDAVGRIDAGRVDLEADPHLPVALTSVWITGEDGVPITDVGFYIADSMGLRVFEDMLRVAEPASGLGSSPGEAELAVALPGVLRADDYLVGVYIYSGHDYYVVEEPLRFRVAPAPGESEDGLRPAVRPRLRWSVTAVER